MKQLEPLKEKEASNSKEIFKLRGLLDGYKKQLQKKTEELV